MAKHVVEIKTYAVVKTKVIVDADSKAEAIKKAEKVESEQDGITDMESNTIEGIGDLVWKYDEISPESVDDFGGIKGLHSHEIKTQDNSRTVGRLRCEMLSDCMEEVTHIDINGFIYCKKHGKQRKNTMRCRELTAAEVKQLESGNPLPKY